MKLTKLLKNISPFNNQKEMPVLLYIVKKILAFSFIYVASAVIGEAIIVGILCAMGYDPLNGVMPSGNIAQLMQYYGFAIFFIVAILYSKFVEKRTLKSIGFTKKGTDYLVGGVIAVVLLLVIVAFCVVSGALNFIGFMPQADIGYLLWLFFGFVIQSAAEEVICRGFLLKSLCEKTNVLVGVLVSSTAFAFPHLSSLLEADTPYAIVGVLNLYLVSAVFSLLYLLRSNIYIVSGLHCLWNFVLNGVMGLSVSGSNTNSNALISLNVNGESLLNGGVYGLEASIIATVVLAITAVILITVYNKSGVKNGL